MRLLQNPKFDFIKLQKPFVIGSIVAAVISAGAIATKGLNWGVDFTGGAQVVYAFNAKPDENRIRQIVEGAKVPVTSVQRYDKAEKNQVLLRVPMEQREGRDVSREVTKALTTALFPKGLERRGLRPEPQRRRAALRRCSSGTTRRRWPRAPTRIRESSTTGSPRRSSRRGPVRASSPASTPPRRRPGSRRPSPRGSRRRRSPGRSRSSARRPSARPSART